MIKKEFYKQIIVICGILIIIFVLIGIYFYTKDKNEYEYFEDNDFNSINSITEIDNSKDIEQEIVIHITGEVNNPGIVKLKEGARVIDAIEAAGGTTDKANLSAINLAYLLEDGNQVYVPSIDDDIDQSMQYSSQTSQKPLRVNINTANSTELQKLPGVGAAMAERIITYRKENGKFNSTDELKNVSGIGETKYSNMKQYVYVK